jgi:hypothetical protein
VRYEEGEGVAAGVGDGSARLRPLQYRWEYTARNIAALVAIPGMLWVLVGVSQSQFVDDGLRVAVLCVTSASLAAAVAGGFFRNLPLRLRANRAARTAHPPIIFTHCVTSHDDGTRGASMGRGWLEAGSDDFAIKTVDARGNVLREIRILYERVVVIERVLVAGGRAYPRLLLKEENLALEFLVPSQSGLTFRGISDRALSEIINELRDAARRRPSY